MDRGQAHTLEAFMAALLLVGALIFATQATAVTPLSASTSNQHIENQQRLMANDVLAVADEREACEIDDASALEEAILFVHENGSYVNASVDDESYSSPGDEMADPEGNYCVDEYGEEVVLPFGLILNETFTQNNIAFNVEVGDEQMVSMGTPSDNAAVATRHVVLYNDMEVPRVDETLRELEHEDEGEEEVESEEEEEGENERVVLYDGDPDRTVYAVVEVRIEVWRL